MKYITLFLLLFSLSSFASNEIVAVVGDDIITSNLLNTRYKITLKERNYKPEDISPQDEKRLKMQILQSLINEKILRHEAAKLEITTTPADIDNAIKHIEKTQNIASGSFKKEIQAQGLPLAVVIDQITNTILWEKMMGELFVPKIEISIKEIYEFMDKFHPERVLVNYYSFTAPKNDRKTLTEIQNNLKNCEQVKNPEIIQFSKRKVATQRINTTLKDITEPEIQEVIISPNTKKSVIFEAGSNSIEFALLCSKEYKVTPDNITHLRNLLKEKKAHLQLDQYIKKARQKRFIEIYNIE